MIVFFFFFFFFFLFKTCRKEVLDESISFVLAYDIIYLLQLNEYVRNMFQYAVLFPVNPEKDDENFDHLLALNFIEFFSTKDTEDYKFAKEMAKIRDAYFDKNYKNLKEFKPFNEEQKKELRDKYLKYYNDIKNIVEKFSNPSNNIELEPEEVQLLPELNSFLSHIIRANLPLNERYCRFINNNEEIKTYLSQIPTQHLWEINHTIYSLGLYKETDIDNKQEYECKIKKNNQLLFILRYQRDEEHNKYTLEYLKFQQMENGETKAPSVTFNKLDSICDFFNNTLFKTYNKQDLIQDENFNSLLNAVQEDMKKQGINKHIKEDDVKMLPAPEYARKTREIITEQQKCGIEYDNKGIGRLKNGITPEKYQDNLYKCAMDYFYPKKTKQAIKNITNKKHNQSNTKNLENNENIIKK